MDHNKEILFYHPIHDKNTLDGLRMVLKSLIWGGWTKQVDPKTCKQG